MSKNITWLGSSYSGVEKIDLPQTGGGTARFTDTSPTTATDSDVASGKIYFKSDGSQSTGTNSGGGSGGSLTQDQDGYLVVPTTGGGGGSTGLEYEEGTYTPTVDTSNVTISFANEHDTRPFTILFADVSESRTDGLTLMFNFASVYDAFGSSVLYGDDNVPFQAYARTVTWRVNSGATSLTAGGKNITSLSDGDQYAIGFYVSSTGFMPNRTLQTVLKANHTYKWIAVWAPST